MTALVSINVGLPRELAWQGRTVRTAIWKQPVAGRVFAARLNLAGDGQGDLSGHGGEHRAVLVYQLGSHRYWADYLRRKDFAHGDFGENFTVDGLADDEVCIGDRFRIGDAVFEVSQPRVTCYRLGLRLDHPEMPALLVSHRRPGFYFRVIREGEVAAGDRIEKIADGPERMTVAEIDSLLYSSHHPIDAIRRALLIPPLSPGWQASMRALLDAAEKGGSIGNAGLSAMPAAPLSWRGFRALKVVAAKLEATDIRSFELAAPDGVPLPAALPGQHIAIRLRPDAGARPILRTYSLCGPGDSGTYAIAVKNEGGPGSGFLSAQIQVGDLLEASAPRGTFTLGPGMGPVVLLSAGIGITPLLAMLRAIVREGSAAREVWWFHAARDSAHQAFAEQVRLLMKDAPRGRVCIVYSRPGTDDLAGSHYDRSGHLSVAVLEQAAVPRSADFYLCGPAGFLAELVAGLREWQVDASRIHTEVFGPADSLAPGVVGGMRSVPRLPPGPEGTGPNVAFLRSGIALRWDTRFRSLLELAEACSVPVRWSCRSGVCHTCESGLIEGHVRHSPEPLDPPPEGVALICCATPTSDLALDL